MDSGNADIMQEEMVQRDVMAANRDVRVWALAKGGDAKVDDSNLPKVRTLLFERLRVTPE